LQIDR
jgi:hypothetical protein